MFKNPRGEILRQLCRRQFSPPFLFNASFFVSAFLAFFLTEDYLIFKLLFGFLICLFFLPFKTARFFSVIHLIPLLLSLPPLFESQEKRELSVCGGKVDEVYATAVKKEGNYYYLRSPVIYCGFQQIKMHSLWVGINRGKAAEGMPYVSAGNRILLTDMKILPEGFHLVSDKNSKLVDLTRRDRYLQRKSGLAKMLHKADYYIEGETAGLFKAILLGERSDLSKRRKGEFADLGVFHIFAISGLHVGILFLWFYAAIAAIAQLPFKPNNLGTGRVFALLAALGAVWVYLHWIGMPVTAVRSWWLLAAFVLGRVALWRVPSSIIILMIANGMLIWEPELIGNTGFRLSFLSVFAIFYLLSVFPPKLPNAGKTKGVLRFLVFGFLLTLVIELCIYPLLSVFHPRINPFNPLNNLVHVFFLSWVFVPLGILSVGMGLLAFHVGAHYVEYLTFRLLELVGEIWLKMIEWNHNLTSFFIVETESFEHSLSYWLYYSILSVIALTIKIRVDYLNLSKKLKLMP